MDLIHICQHGAHIHGAVYAVTESIAKIVAASGGDYRKIRLTFQEYFRRMTEDPTAGASQLQHFSVHIRHRWDSDFHPSVERTVCLEHSMISMYHQHWYHLQWMCERKDIITPELKKAGNNWFVFVSQQMHTIFQYMRSYESI